MQYARFSFLLILRPAPSSTLFPYTTLFRSLLQWATGNIGLHHVHHLHPRIPNYRLQQALDDHAELRDRKSTRLNSSHTVISYAVFCLKKKTGDQVRDADNNQDRARKVQQSE